MAFIGHAFDGMVAFVQHHAAWAAPLAFALAFVQSLAFVSLLLPSTLTILVIGGLVAASGIGFVPVWFAVSIGAALGDWISYAIGWRLKGRVGSVWPFSRHPELLPRGERFFRRWGWAGVVICRFFHPLRATVPVLCGAFGMRALTFQLANWGSAFLWAGALLGPAKVLTRWLA